MNKTRLYKQFAITLHFGDLRLEVFVVRSRQQIINVSDECVEKILRFESTCLC